MLDKGDDGDNSDNDNGDGGDDDNGDDNDNDNGDDNDNGNDGEIAERESELSGFPLVTAFNVG